MSSSLSQEQVCKWRCSRRAWVSSLPIGLRRCACSVRHEESHLVVTSFCPRTHKPELMDQWILCKLMSVQVKLSPTTDMPKHVHRPLLQHQPNLPEACVTCCNQSPVTEASLAPWFCLLLSCCFCFCCLLFLSLEAPYCLKLVRVNDVGVSAMIRQSLSG